MDARLDPSAGEATHEVLYPEHRRLPLVFASPHSGSNYPREFVAASRLDALSLRRSEDSFVDEIFASAPLLGAPLIRALFPRAFVDPNREPYELDPAMFDEPLPSYANSGSPRVAAGLGTIARIVASGAEIYREKLSLSEGLARIERYYRPYHHSLERLVEETRREFGFCILVDCHSMPSGSDDSDPPDKGQSVDFIIGDCHGSACAPQVTRCVVGALRGFGYRVRRNKPYAGGFVTRHYGRPAEGLHALQIEINRALYMDESRILRAPGLATLARRMEQVIRELGALTPGDLTGG